MPSLPLPGCDLYYEVHGQGPPLLFAHGIGGTHLSWWQQIPHFRDHYTCITFSHRGFHPSRLAGGDGPIAARFVDDLAALVDHLALADVRLVAQSMGGVTCLGYALREPARVRALVMACTAGSLAPDPGLPPGAGAEARAALQARGIHPAAGERMAREQPALHFLYQQVDRLNVGLDKEALRQEVCSLRTTPPETVASLDVPVLCLTGEEDVAWAPAEIARLASLLPRGHLERVPACGHSIYFERPRVFNRLVGDFLASVDHA